MALSGRTGWSRIRRRPMDQKESPQAPADQSTPLLEISRLVVRYGSAQALNGVDLHVNPGEIVGILGSNGAGKSTLLKTISGLLRPTEGSIRFSGRDITSDPPRARIISGISQAVQGSRVFQQQTVRENLELGAYVRSDGRQAISSDMGRMFGLFAVLQEKQKLLAASLSGGQQQMLSVAQAMMARPQLLLLDEPSAGLAPVAIGALKDRLRELRDAGITLLMVEQVLPLALELCDRLYFLRNGSVAIPGARPADISPDDVRSVYIF